MIREQSREEARDLVLIPFCHLGEGWGGGLALSQDNSGLIPRCFLTEGLGL